MYVRPKLFFFLHPSLIIIVNFAIVVVILVMIIVMAIVIVINMMVIIVMIINFVMKRNVVSVFNSTAANIWHRCLTERLLYLHSFCNIYQYHYSAVFIIALNAIRAVAGVASGNWELCLTFYPHPYLIFVIFGGTLPHYLGL